MGAARPSTRRRPRRRRASVVPGASAGRRSRSAGQPRDRPSWRRRRACRRYAEVAAAGGVLCLGERVVEPCAERERDHERRGGGEDRERGQAGLAGRPSRSARAIRAAARSVAPRVPRPARAASPSHTPSCIRRLTVAATSVRPSSSRVSLAIVAVAHGDHPVGARGDAGVVGDEHDRLAALVVHVRSSAITSRALAESRLPVGSSASRTSGRLISARAIATRCCWPPESRVGRLLGVLGDAQRRSAARCGAAWPRGALRPASRPGSSTLSATERLPIRLKNWKTKPISRRRTMRPLRLAEAARRACRRARSRPLVGRSRPPSRFSSVDFPQPDGP